MLFYEQGVYLVCSLAALCEWNHRNVVLEGTDLAPGPL